MAELSFIDLEFFKSVRAMALEIQELNAIQRIAELEKIKILEKQKKVNLAWITITKLLLTDSEAIEKILYLAEQELTIHATPNRQEVFFHQVG